MDCPWIENCQIYTIGNNFNVYCIAFSSEILAIFTDSHHLVSVGLTTRWRLTDHIHLRFDWGRALIDVPTLGESNPQDDGIHLGLTVRFP